MNRLRDPRFPLVRILALIAFAALVPGATAQGDTPTAFFGNDPNGLKSALDADSANLGLRMRYVLAQLDRVQKTVNKGEKRRLLDLVEKNVRTIYQARPGFGYPYRVLAKLEYRKNQLPRCIEVIEEFAKREELDYEIRSLKINSQLRLASMAKDGDTIYHDAAAAEITTWMMSQTAPPVGPTLGTLTAWLRDEELRAKVLAQFEARRQQEPQNLNLAISYAISLITLGRRESAWKVVQEAERVGLCDPRTGARHPVATLLRIECVEPSNSASYDGLEVERLQELVAEHPEHLGLAFRLAVRMKKRGDAKKKLADVARKIIEDADQGWQAA